PPTSGGAASGSSTSTSGKAAPATQVTPSNPEGKALAAKVAEKMGGAEKLKSVHSMRAKLAQQAKDEPTSQLDIPIPYPDPPIAPSPPMGCAWGRMQVVLPPSGAFRPAQGKGRPTPASAAKESLDQIKRDPTFIAAHTDDPKFTFTANGSEKISNIEAKIVDV